MTAIDRIAALKSKVYDANISLQTHGLVIFTWGNASAIDRESGLIVIKPSGVEYDELKPEHMVVVDSTGDVVEGTLKPSSDTPTHIELYKEMPANAIVHTHSPWATVFAQAGSDIPIVGTTHADHFYGPVPCTREMTRDEISSDYEKNTGVVINELFTSINPQEVPAALVRGHGSFAWGDDTRSAVYHAVVLEYIAQMAYRTMSLANDIKPMSQTLIDRHFLRKHGSVRYYGQESGQNL